VVHGKRAGSLAERYEEFEPLAMSPGATLEYRVVVRYETWMRGADLVLDGVRVGCCTSEEVRLGRIAERILYADPVYEMRLVETPIPQSTGQQMAQRYSFIAPATELEQIRRSPQGADYNMSLDLGNGPSTPARRQQVESERIIAQTREGSLSVFFAQGSRRIDRNFGDNNRNLVEMISAVRALSESDDSRISRIVIAGFASPEGSATLNDRLAWDRASAVKEFLVDNSNIDPSVVELFNGSVDWKGLRDLVERSDMYQKRRILTIIDNTPVWDNARDTGRLGELMRLEGGEPYRRMLREFFPQLRQAAYIKVYYESK
jgi:outer membrane protein OmpA-like peptidoglycan-associated protein